MIRKFVTIVVLLFLSHNALSQRHYFPGVRGGVNLAQITNTHTEPLVGYYIGVTYSFKVTDKFTIQPEISYSVEGATGSRVYDLPPYPDENGFLVEPTERRKLDGKIRYRSFAIINKYAVSPKINLLAGGSVGTTSDSDRFVDNDTEIALVAGFDYKLLKRLAVDLRFKHGLTDLFTEDTDFTDRYSAHRNNYNFVVQIGLAYTFDLTFKK